MAGLLFARAGCTTLVLEKHADFLRDFRGDTVHPSTLEVMKELGLLEKFLERPHQPLTRLAGTFSGKRIEITDFSRIKAACKFIAFMPQWHFLDFVIGAAKSLPTFSVAMEAEVTDLIEADGRVTGVHAQTPAGPLDVTAKLTIGADGRHSTVRDRAGFAVEAIGAPMDVLWFRVPREPSAPGSNDEETLFNAGPGHIIITIDRGDYYQCAFVIPKGEADAVKARGLDAFRKEAVATAPQIAPHIDQLTSLDDVKLLTVAIDRLSRWSRPGLVLIGDSAHAMSPIGGVGINLAIQDAVAAANLLAGPLADGALTDADLAKVRKRRLFPVKVTQFIQVRAQNNIVKPILSDRKKAPGTPLLFRLVARFDWLKRRAATMVGLGVRPEHVRSPERHEIVV